MIPSTAPGAVPDHHKVAKHDFRPEKPVRLALSGVHGGLEGLDALGTVREGPGSSPRVSHTPCPSDLLPAGQEPEPACGRPPGQFPPPSNSVEKHNMLPGFSFCSGTTPTGQEASQEQWGNILFAGGNGKCEVGVSLGRGAWEGPSFLPGKASRLFLPRLGAPGSCWGHAGQARVLSSKLGASSMLPSRVPA